MDYTVCGISPHEYWAMEEVDALLQQEGIQRDKNLDYTCVIYDDDLHVIATGSCFRNTLRCFATSNEYQGEGLLSQVTGLYNRIMAEELPKAGITFREIPRRESGGAPVSASKVRLLLCDGNYEALKDLLPASTLSYFQSPEAEPVLERIRAAEEVVHY